MPDSTDVFLQHSRTLLVTDYLPKIEQCVGALRDDDVWWRPNEASNSVGNLVLHLCGNVSQWILESVGGRPFKRRRQEEFDERGPIPSAELLRRIRTVVHDAGEVIVNVSADQLMAKRQIQGYDVTVLEAIYHVVEHFSMHTGQIIWIAKARTGADLSLWAPPAP
jgi:uncharacterized damage-inducible protein DinB